MAHVLDECMFTSTEWVPGRFRHGLALFSSHFIAGSGPQLRILTGLACRTRGCALAIPSQPFQRHSDIEFEIGNPVFNWKISAYACNRSLRADRH